MTAQVHLDLRREPAQSIVAVAADDKGGFRKIVLFRDGLQALVVQPGIEGQTAAGLPWKGLSANASTWKIVSSMFRTPVSMGCAP